MAKDIKAIQCPKCGSVFKDEIKPNFYRCQNCGTEYYLDSDDVHIYYHHQNVPLPASTASPGNTRLPVYILIAAILFIVVVYFVAMLFQPKISNSSNRNSIYKSPRMYSGSFIYANTVTGDPVYLRFGTESTYDGNNKSPLEFHAQYNDAVNGKLIADRIMPKENQLAEGCLLSVKTYSPDMIYAISCNTALFQVDAKNDQFLNVTRSVFKDFPELSSGVARLEFDYEKLMINVMSNDGNSYHYFPTIRKLVAGDEPAEQVWKKEFDRHYFEFGYLGDDRNANQLIEAVYDKQTGHTRQRDLTPGRKYFNPKIIYQDDKNLLISVNTTAAESSPITIQRIDVMTGKIVWALSPDNYYLYSTAKCKQGFAIEYRKDEEADYVHGVLVISAAGKLVNNYKLARTE